MSNSDEINKLLKKSSIVSIQEVFLIPNERTSCVTLKRTIISLLALMIENDKSKI